MKGDKKEMKKSLKIIMLAIISLGLLLGVSACQNTLSEEKTITVVDMDGVSIEVKKNPTKVASISRTTYDLLVAYGLGDKIDGAYSGTLNNKWLSTIYPESKNHYVYGYQNSYELFIERGVDLVFAPERYIADELNERGIPALCVSLYGTPRFDEFVLFFSQLVTQIWDSAEVKRKAKVWENRVTKAVNEIQTELNKHSFGDRTLFYIRGDKDRGVGYTDTAGSFTEYAYKVLGFKFAGSTFNTNKPSTEEIMALNPDVFVAGGIYQNKNIDLLKTTEPYMNLDAVKNNRVYSIPIGVTAFEQLSAMTPIFLYDQANKIYPELFSFDIPTMVKETILEYFGYQMTDTEVEYMLNGLAPDGTSLIS